MCKCNNISIGKIRGFAEWVTHAKLNMVYFNVHIYSETVFELTGNNTTHFDSSPHKTITSWQFW